MKKYENLLSRIAEAGVDVTTDVVTTLQVNSNWLIEIYKNNKYTDFEIEVININTAQNFERIYNIPTVDDLEHIVSKVINIVQLPHNQDHTEIKLWNTEADYMEYKTGFLEVIND